MNSEKKTKLKDQYKLYWESMNIFWGRNWYSLMITTILHKKFFLYPLYHFITLGLRNKMYYVQEKTISLPKISISDICTFSTQIVPVFFFFFFKLRETRILSGNPTRQRLTRIKVIVFNIDWYAISLRPSTSFRQKQIEISSSVSSSLLT